MKKLALIAAAGIVLMAGSAHAQVAGRGNHPGGGHPGGGHRGGHGGGWNGGHHGGNWGHHGGWNRHGWGNGSFFGGFGFGGFWQQPQYHVQNWQLYGFIDPGPQRRWVRYYDDAYLVDGRGYVHDSRRRMNWDRYGERWQRDGQGIPYYAGRGDYRPRRDDRGRRGGHAGGDYGVCGGRGGRGHPACGGDRHGDYERDRYGHYDDDYRDDDRGHDGYDRDERHVRVERYGDGYDGRGGDVRTRVYTVPGGGAYGHGGYGYGSGYSGTSGYGYGYGHGGYGAGTVVVTETTVTPGEVVTEEIIEEVVEERGHVRHRRHAPRRAAPPPRRRHTPPPAPRVYLPRGDRG